MFCKFCGTQMNDGDLFCPNCGQMRTNVASVTRITGIQETQQQTVNTTNTLQQQEVEATSASSTDGEQLENNTVNLQTDSSTMTSTASDNSSTTASSTQSNSSDGWAELVNEKAAHQKTKITFWIFLGLFIIAGICTIYFYNQYNNYSRGYYSQIRQISDLQTENRNLQDENKKLNDSISGIQDSFYSPVAVKITKVYNGANNSTNLIGNEITYLYFDYTVFKLSAVNSNDKLYVKVIRPDGMISSGQSSPNGYSFTVDMNSNSWGWGSQTPGNSYGTRGYYTIEFWYQSVCVGRKVVHIN